METATARFSSTIGEEISSRELGVERNELRPVGLLGQNGSGVALRDRRLQRVRAAGGLETVGSSQCVNTTPDEELVPGAPVLVQQQDGLSGGPDAGAQSGRLELHEGDEAVHLGLVGHEARQHTAQAERLGAEICSNPVFARGGRVSLVEDEVDHFEDGTEPHDTLRAGRHLEGDPRLGDGPLGSDDALADGGFGHDVGAGDLGNASARR